MAGACAKASTLNVGIGRRTSVNFAGHVSDFVSFLEAAARPREHPASTGTDMRILPRASAHAPSSLTVFC